MIYILFLLLFSSCGMASEYVAPAAAPLPYIENTFVPYYETFLTQADKHHRVVDVTGLTIRTVPTIPNLGTIVVRAYCYQKSRRVDVAATYWNTANDTCRQELIYHELGHCVLGRDHNNNKIYVNNFEIPGSYLNPAGLPCDYVVGAVGWVSEYFRDTYLNELFQVGR